MGEALAFVHLNDKAKVEGAVKTLRNAYKITDKDVKCPKAILGIVE